MSEDSSEIILYKSKAKFLRLFLTSIAFTILGILMLNTGDKMGWYVSIFFGLCSIVSLLILLSTNYLRLSEEGFEIHSLFGKNFTKWKDVGYFNIKHVGVLRMVRFNYSPDYHKFKTGKKVVKMLTGTEGALPDTYGKTPEELVKLMNEWKINKST